ncbi:hypothetical protein LTR56_010615 [Elasticomyces elasticus]|nr:hypothetical protein LTR56_010615 [Elasticomyces elasticus]KAK3648646.1 hypothetical protein LTR22_013282 [Elasticomyces elasticus]KAK4932471.1 hypothetical protein LTR49_001340 [Elasticomyces elasticus]KAK5760172.1 hypothetical protein LTS12_009727 [Elasticomyces elasticus]
MATPRMTVDLTTPEASQQHEASMLDVPELLENVLLYLPLRDIIQAQRVSKHWLDSIKSSPRIQQALFFRPKPTQVRQTACPVIGLQVINPEGWSEEAHAIPTTGVDIIMGPGSTEYKVAQAVETSSLGRMLIRQPPVYEMDISPDMLSFHASLHVHNDKGVTVMDVGKLLQEHVRHCETCKTASTRYGKREYSHRYSTWWPFTWSLAVQRSKARTRGWTVLAKMTKKE